MEYPDALARVAFGSSFTPAKLAETLFVFVPRCARFALREIGANGYFGPPNFAVDLLPDFLPALGQLDDLVVLLLGFKLFLRLCPPDVVQQLVKAIAGGR
jgi:uncharacterized membrane protein YkvA (DUF1232 family)